MKNKNKNSGDWNSGYWNSGNGNSGYWNSGDGNSGNWNSGDWNSGDRNPGSYNSGDYNSGNWNSGDWNSGGCNSGLCNSGDWNSGNWNSGDWNSGNWNSGFFNTTTPKIRIFNKETNLKRNEITFPSYFNINITEWVSEYNMKEIEKSKNKSYKITKGYLKVYDYKEAWKKSFEEKCDKAQAEMTVNLPNFDYDIFEKITGITKKMLTEKRGVKKKTKPNPFDCFFKLFKKGLFTRKRVF